MPTIGTICGTCGQTDTGERASCSRCSATYDAGAPVAIVMVNVVVAGTSIRVGPTTEFRGNWLEDNRRQVETGLAAALASPRNDQAAATAPTDGPSIELCLAILSPECRRAYETASDPTESEDSRRRALDVISNERTAGAKHGREESHDERRSRWRASMRVWSDAHARSQAIDDAASKAIRDAYLAGAETIFAALTVTDLPPLLRAHAEHRYSARRRIDLRTIADGIEATWPTLRDFLFAHPGVKSVDAAKAIGASSGAVASLTYYLAGTGAIRRETAKNRVRLWYVGEAIDPVRIRSEWTWLTETLR